MGAGTDMGTTDGQLERIATCAAILLLALGCKGEGRSHVEGTIHTDDVVERFEDEDLEPKDFKEVDPAPYRAGYCSQGMVSGVDTLICEYTSDDNLDRGKKIIEEKWSKEGANTSIVRRNGRTLLAIADRKKADPQGKVINTMAKAMAKEK